MNNQIFKRFLSISVVFFNVLYKTNTIRKDSYQKLFKKTCMKHTDSFLLKRDILVISSQFILANLSVNMSTGCEVNSDIHFIGTSQPTVIY